MNKKILLLIAIVIVLAIPVCFAAELNTTDNLDKAVHQAQNQSKKVMIVFDGEGCTYCDMLKHDVLENDKVISELNRDYVVVILDTAKNPDIASKYKIFGTPTTVILGNNSKEIGRIDGYVDVDEFLNELKEI